jgi:His/Glu/Gln/Arg/opine family amino acid ABC transporter permease subunit
MHGISLDSFIENLPQMWPLFQAGLLATIKLSLGAVTVGLVVGLALCFARVSGSQVLRKGAGVYIELMRGTPALVQLFLIYFGLARLGISLNTFNAAVLALGLNLAAYVAEILRAGLLSVSDGQKEAAHALGMTTPMSMRFIILPQALRTVLAPLGNASISLIKDTSIAALISAPDLVLQARNLASEYFIPFPIFLFVGLMYFGICFPLSLMFRSLERRWTIRGR